MDVYSASDGGVIQLHRHLSEFESIEEVISDVSTSTGVAIGNVLLFMEDGRELKQAVLQEVWARGGEGQGSNPAREVLYMFNREAFWSDAEEWAVQLQEEVFLPPELNVSSIQSVEQAQEPFLMAFDHISHLQSLFLAQSRALQIAYSNLSHHLQPLLKEFAAFAGRVEKELDYQERLLKNSTVDLAVLPKVVIHEAFVRKKDRDRDKEGGDDRDRDRVKTLADYVHQRKMEEVRESCREVHEDHVNRFNQLAAQMDELGLQSEAEASAAEDKVAAVAAEFAEGLARIEAALEQVQTLLNSEGEYGDHLLDLDQAMRDDLVALTGVKNDYTLDVHIHLRQVALFQIRITEFVDPVKTLEGDLKSKGAFPHLTRLHQLPFAYGTAVIEAVRRKEFSAFLLDWTTKLSDTLAKFTGNERKRRTQVGTETLGLLPFPMPWVAESTNPRVDVRVEGGGDALAGMALGRTDIDNLIRSVEELRNDPELVAKIGSDVENPIPALQASLESLVAKMDIPNGELDRMIERSVLMTSSRSQPRSSADLHASQRLSTQLRLAQQEKIEQEKRILELESTHKEAMRHIEETSEQRVHTLQTRLGEMQDELVRLRTDLGEEMMARQALSAELDERSREQDDKQREQEDQADLITALQAEIAQEKDRATDLGVRLQEALLDVDGLKNSEHTLIGQLQGLQDERTRHSAELSEAAAEKRGLESTIAGMSAELQAVNQQLIEARQERDAALKNQSAEAERVMRDHIAEADGDRAVLEHQNLTLTKQLEDLRVETDEQLKAAKNTAVRQADGLKAELSFTKAQLRDAQRREAVLADELAMARDNATSVTQASSHQSDVARDAVAMSSKYHETCQRLFALINASSTISGPAARSSSPPPPVGTSTSTSVLSRDELRESVMIRSLATAQEFDLVGFADAVTRTIGLVKKWSKTCKQYRESARNKITFANFTKGDLALFLPTRNAAKSIWAAFNISAPHNFLKIDERWQEKVNTREWIMARIVTTDEAVAGDTPATNPYGLAEGLRYFTHHVEEYDPQTARTPRRSTSTGMNGMLGGDASISQMLTSTHRPVSAAPPVTENDEPDGTSPNLPATTPFTPGRPRNTSRLESGYFPTMASVVSPPVPPADAAVSKDEPSVGAPLPPPSSSSLVPPVDVTPTPPMVAPADPPRLSPLAESGSTTKAAAAPPTSPTSHQRIPSRNSVSPGARDTPIFAPSSLGRPASVASSHSSNLRGLPVSAATGKAAPAMAVTTSGEDSLSNSLIESRSRRTSLGKSPVSTGGGAIMPGSFSPGKYPISEEGFRHSPLSGQGHSQRPQPGPVQLQTQAPGSVQGEGDGSAVAGGGPGSNSVAAVARSISRGFSIGRKRTPSMATIGGANTVSSGGVQSGTGGDSGVSTPGAGGEARPKAAVDILKQYGKGGER